MDTFINFMTRYGKYIGLVFTALVVGLLVYLHVFAEVQVPLLSVKTDDGEVFQVTETHLGDQEDLPDFLICGNEVDWLDEDYIVMMARNTWSDLGYQVNVPRRVECNNLCEHGDEGRLVPCEPGAVVVSLRDQYFSEDHWGETLVHAVDGKIVWATILLPGDIFGPDDLEDDRVLPQDVHALVLAHELGHWWGFDHAFTPIIPGVLDAHPTGHLMNDDGYSMGWSTDGIARRE